jgi:hypothetical protein
VKTRVARRQFTHFGILMPVVVTLLPHVGATMMRYSPAAITVHDLDSLAMSSMRVH